MAKKAVLYARVSTKSQADKGASIPQQMDALRKHAAREGYEVVAEVEAPAEPNDTIEWAARPKLAEVWGMVRDGGVDAVFAQDSDRLVRDPILRAVLNRMFAEQGATLCALDDHGGNTEDAELLDYITGYLAKKERRKTALRTARTKVSEAERGRVMPARYPHYGYVYDRGSRRFEVDPAKAPHVLRLFGLVGAQGRSMSAVKKAFEVEGVKPPGYEQAVKAGKRTPKHWHVSTIKRIITNPVYRTLSYDEIAPLVSAEVAAGLDKEARYGVYWFNRNRVEKKGGRRINHGEKPREDWVALPVPDLGIPPEWVDAARAKVADNTKPTRSDDGWPRELHGFVYCPYCGRSLTTFKNNNTPPGRYYVCSRLRQDGRGACPDAVYRPAAELEREVMGFIGRIFENPEKLLCRLDERIEQERQRLHDPEEEAETLAQQIEDLAAERRGYLRSNARGAMTDAELDQELARLDAERASLEEAYARAQNRQQHIDQMERDRDELWAASRSAAPPDLAKMTPEQRREIYRKISLRANAYAGGDTEIWAVYDPSLPADAWTRPGGIGGTGITVKFAGEDKYEAQRHRYQAAAELFRADCERDGVDPQDYRDAVEEGEIPEEYFARAEASFSVANTVT
ncbi:MAG: recombinase family protein [Actinomycetota bacterium]|nr:recombinase family protein [Actinomycetota bacterium]